ncbi:MAG: hypothetical protein HY738_18055, partial [Bacteroidia bacterium]|nr:hypothetical protein [Bacteroidia bacterium]
TDTPLENIVVKRIQGLFTHTGSDGYYQLPADTGTNIIITFITDNVMQQTCPANNSGYIIYLANVGDSSENNNFGINFRNIISGYIYLDNDSNCVFDSANAPLNNNIIQLNPGPVYCNTDVNGYYKFAVDTGVFTFAPVITNPLYYPSCPDTTGSYTVIFTNLADSSMNNGIGFSSYAYGCGDLSVGMIHIGFRPCFCSWYKITYSNNGTGIAENAFIELELPTEVTPVTACSNGGWNLPPYNSTLWDSQIGNIYIYNLG